MSTWLADRCIQAYKLDTSDRRARALQTCCQIYRLALAPRLVALVRAGARFERGHLTERPEAFAT
ncbi:hypothetical protein ACLMNJ_32795 [Streptomyces seoulensis]